jgi:hypothetical protein
MADDEFALRRDMEAAAQVRTLLENEHVEAAFFELEAAYIATWKATPARDTEGREKLWQAVQIVWKVKSHLDAVAANGRLAERQIAEITARPKRFGIV